MAKTLWTIRENATLTAERFQRFIETARQAGMTPAAVLQRLILSYIGEAPHDSQDDTRRDLREG
jgi:hypothetical protein